MSRPPILAMALTLLAGCQVYPSPPGLEPLEQPRALEAAPPRVNATIPSGRSRGDFEARGVATTPVVELASGAGRHRATRRNHAQFRRH